MQKKGMLKSIIEGGFRFMINIVHSALLDIGLIVKSVEGFMYDNECVSSFIKNSAQS